MHAMVIVLISALAAFALPDAGIMNLHGRQTTGDLGSLVPTKCASACSGLLDYASQCTSDPLGCQTKFCTTEYLSNIKNCVTCLTDDPTGAALAPSLKGLEDTCKEYMGDMASATSGNGDPTAPATGSATTGTTATTGGNANTAPATGTVAANTAATSNAASNTQPPASTPTNAGQKTAVSVVGLAAAAAFVALL